MSLEACLELARRTGRDPDALIEEWLERAAIREFEGSQPRADAERDALADLEASVRRGPRRASSEPAAARKRSTTP